MINTFVELSLKGKVREAYINSVMHLDEESSNALNSYLMHMINLENEYEFLKTQVSDLEEDLFELRGY